MAQHPRVEVHKSATRAATAKPRPTMLGNRNQGSPETEAVWERDGRKYKGPPSLAGEKTGALLMSRSFPKNPAHPLDHCITIRYVTYNLCFIARPLGMPHFALVSQKTKCGAKCVAPTLGCASTVASSYPRQSELINALLH